MQVTRLMQAAETRNGLLIATTMLLEANNTIKRALLRSIRENPKSQRTMNLQSAHDRLWELRQK